MFECYIDRRFYGFVGDISLFISLFVATELTIFVNSYVNGLQTDFIIGTLKDLTVLVIFLTAMARLMINIKKYYKDKNKSDK